MIYKKNIPHDFSNITWPEEYKKNAFGKRFCHWSENSGFTGLFGGTIEDSKIAAVYDIIKQQMEQYLSDQGLESTKYSLQESFINVRKKSEKSDSHNCTDSSFTVIYFINVPAQSGNLYLNDGSEETTIEPQNYDFIIVPSTYFRRTDASDAEEDRISLVCEFFYYGD